MENNNEMVVYGKNGEIVDCKFQRVDMSVPSTILSYCSDVIDAIGNVLDSTAQMSVETEQEMVDAKAIEQISSFGKELDESEKEKESKSLVKGAKKFLGSIGIKYFQESIEKETYKGRYEAYCDLLDQVAEKIERQMQGTLQDIEFIESIKTEMTPLVDQLELMIKVGYQDKEAYDRETEELKANADPADMNAQREINFRTKISEAFNEKLNKLENMLIAYRQQIDSYSAQQLVDMGIVADKEDYLRHSSPLLKAQGSLMIRNRLQSKEIKQSKGVNAAVNNAINENAKELLTNIQESVDLSINGGITTDTLKTVSNTLNQGIQIFANGRKAKAEKIKKDTEARRELKDSLNRFNEEFLNYVDGEVFGTEVLPQTSKQKRLGGK